MMLKITPHTHHFDAHFAYINTEKIIRVMIYKMTVSIWLDEKNYIDVTPEEWARIEQVIVSDSALPVPALTEGIVYAWRVCMLKRQQNSEFVFEADDVLVEALGQILPSPTFTDDEMES